MCKSITCLLLLIYFLPATITAQTFFSTKGKYIIGIDGKPFQIKGTNLGNWLVPEGYLFQFKDVNSPRLITQALLELIGPEEVKSF
jgi:endoglucanase